MSSRPSSDFNDVRNPQRDRTPPKFTDRRSSAPYGAALSSRTNDSGYRSNESNSYNGAGRDFSREPPRGPKGHTDGQRGGGFPPRGRGFAGRVDSRDRETRDVRDPPIQKRDNDREWPRRDTFENRDQRPSPTGQNHSRSPVPRDFRETRDPPPRDLDLTRTKRDSRDAPLSAVSIPEAPASAPFFGRGTLNGRGRGEIEVRGRGRGTFPDDRESSRIRSRSRDRAWTRDFRDDRNRDRDWDAGKNEVEDRHTKEDLDRETDRSRRDVTSFRPSSRNSNVSLTGPSTPHSASIPPSYQNTERYASKPSTPVIDTVRRPMANATTPSVDYFSRNEIHKNTHTFRKDPIQGTYGSHPPSSPPQATQVPAFGSTIPRYTPTILAAQNPASNLHLPKSESIPLGPSKPEKLDPTLLAPIAPKALVGQLPPTAPRAGVLERRAQLNALGSPGHGHNNLGQDMRSSSQPVPPVTGSPSAFRFNGVTRLGGSSRFQQTPLTTASHPARSIDQRLVGNAMPRSHQPDAMPVPDQPAVKPLNQATQPNHFGKTPPRAPIAATASQTSPGGPPSGPRFAQVHAPIRPQVTPVHRPFSGHKTWINPKRNQQPSIMNPMPPTVGASIPAKRDYAGETRTSSIGLDQNSLSSDHTIAYRPHDGPKNGESQLHSRLEEQSKGLFHVEDSSKPEISMPKTFESLDPRPISASKENKVLHDQDDGENSDKLGSASDDEEAMDLDEDDLVEQDKKFDRDIQALEAQRPATPRHHMDLVALLEELNALASAAEDLTNGIIPQPVEQDEKALEQHPTGLPSPKSDEIDDERMEVDDPADFGKSTSIRDETPPLDNLPYLFSGPPTPFSEIQVLQENLDLHDRFKSRVLEVMSRQRVAIASEDEALKGEYARLYKPWREKTNELDQQKRFTSDSMLAPTSPAPTTSPVVTPTPLLEGRRTGRFVSELELQRVIEESKIAAEAEEIREKEAQESQALADLEKEAVIPDMLNRQDAMISMFSDINHLIDTSMVFEVLSFAQAEDDFTAEEHKLFTENYMMYPKKWGHIAETIPGRDYQDCIMHYYLSKKEANYKVQLNRRIGKRGRKVTRGPQARPKSNALMSDMGKGGQLYERNEPEAPQLAVTDTGRPKRAAAPKFGDTIGDLDPSTAAPTPVRRGVAATKGEATTELAVEKATNRRARMTQPKEKGAKRGKAPLLAAAPGPSPQKKEVEVKKPEVKELKLEDEFREKEIEEAKLLASFHTGQPNPPMLSPPKISEGWLGAQRAPTNSNPLGRPPNQQQTPIQKHQQQHIPQEQQTPPKQQSGQPRSGSQTSSYWSVPEQQDFMNLLSFYGTDWPQIAAHLKNKTPVMV